MVTRKKTTTTMTQEHPEPTQIIYLGHTQVEKDPVTNVTFTVAYGTIYSNGIPENVQALRNADPDFNSMFVPVTQASKAMREISNPDSPTASAKASSLRKSQGRMHERSVKTGLKAGA